MKVENNTMREDMYRLQQQIGSQRAKIAALESELAASKQQVQFHKDRVDCERDAKFKAEQKLIALKIKYDQVN